MTVSFTHDQLEYIYIAIQNYEPLDGIPGMSVEQQWEQYQEVKEKLFDYFTQREIEKVYLEMTPQLKEKWKPIIEKSQSYITLTEMLQDLDS